METAVPSIDFKELLSTEEVSFDRLHELRKELHCHVDLRSELEGIAADFAAVARKLSSENKAEIRRGVIFWLLGRVEEAARILQATRSGKERNYFLGLSLLEAGRGLDAVEPLKEARDSETGNALFTSAYLEALVKGGRHDEAGAQLDRLLKKEPSGDLWYIKGLLNDMRGDVDGAVEGYEKSLETEPGHARSLFRLAYLTDLIGQDARALELYEQLRQMRPRHLNVMMNLGVLYDDRGEYERAVQCFQAVLDYFPNHARAKSYLKDAQASMTMFYDEDAARREAKLQQMLSQPLAEISFSPRVRNALQKLGAMTLGELIAKTEEDLLTLSNFGRTSLREVKEFLSSKGVALASSGNTDLLSDPAADDEEEEEDEEAVEPAAGGAPDTGNVLEKNLNDFEWSGRIRKAFEKLGLVTVNDLVTKTEDDLLKTKNLGVTSMKEIHKKLGQLGVSMRSE